MTIHKRCFICGAEAEYCIKGSSECYCEECAVDNFGDITYLIKVEDAARELKDKVDQLIEEGIEPKKEEIITPLDQVKEELGEEFDKEKEED